MRRGVSSETSSLEARWTPLCATVCVLGTPAADALALISKPSNQTASKNQAMEVHALLAVDRVIDAGDQTEWMPTAFASAWRSLLKLKRTTDTKYSRPYFLALMEILMSRFLLQHPRLRRLCSGELQLFVSEKHRC